MDATIQKPKRKVKPKLQPRKAPVRRVYGRILRSVQMSPAVPASDGHDAIPAILKLHWFELTPQGLVIRKFRARRKTATLLTLDRLANFSKPQPELFL